MREKIWYPSVEEIERIHDRVLERNPEKYEGRRVPPVSRLPNVLREARNTPGLYKKLAVLLKGIASEHVFEDGNTTTAILTAKKFLDRNNKEFKPSDQKRIGKVANNHGRFTVEEISQYFKTGEIDETKI